MSTENNTGITWTFEDGDYFLRDDEASGICNYERYSLFRTGPDYQRISIWRGSLDKAILFGHDAVWEARFHRGCNAIDPITVLLDERGQA